jgi:hypothetical protein
MICSKIRFPAFVDAVDWIDPAARLTSPATPELGEILASAAWIASHTAVVKN